MSRTYSYDPRILTYLERTNAGQRRLSSLSVSHDVTRIALAARNAIRAYATQVVNRNLPLQKFYDETTRTMKQSYYAAVAAARGKKPDETLRDAEIAFLLWLLLRQFNHLNDFMDDIEAGKAPIDGRFVNRAGMYGMAAKGIFENWKLWEAGQNGYLEAKRVLGMAEHCNDSRHRPGCEELAAAGWMPIQNVTPIGEATCLSNCQCHLEFRNRGGLSAGSPFTGVFLQEQRRQDYIDVRDNDGHLLFKYDPATKRVQIKHKYMGAARVVDLDTLRVETEENE